MLDDGPLGRVERTQQIVTQRREEEHVSKVEIQDNLLQRMKIHHTTTRIREEWIEETAMESPDL